MLIKVVDQVSKESHIPWQLNELNDQYNQEWLNKFAVIDYVQPDNQWVKFEIDS